MWWSFTATRLRYSDLRAVKPDIIMTSITFSDYDIADLLVDGVMTTETDAPAKV